MSQDTDPATTRSEAVAWSGPAGDGDEQRFADIVESATLDDVTQDAVLVGEPYDGGATDRPGAREGPDAIRAALADLQTHHFDAGPVSSVGDLGDIDVPAGESVTAVQRQVREVAAAVHEADAIPVFLGGDGSLTGANVGPLLARQRADGGYVTDGGFGEDDEDVGEVEHFDPTGGASADDEDEEPTDEETVDVEEEIVIDGEGEESAEAEETSDDSDDSDETPDDEREADDEDQEEAESEGKEEQTETDEDGGDAESEDDGGAESEDDGGAESEDDGGAESEDEGAETDEDESEHEDAESEADEKSEDEAAEPGDGKETEDGDGEQTADDEVGETPGEVETVVSGSIEHGSAGRKSGGSTSDSETVGVVSLDAHLDCRIVDGQPSSATTYRQLFGAGLDALAVVGARHFESSTDEAEYLREQGGTVVTAEEVGEDAVVAADRALDALGDVDAVYVSVDLDILDSTAAPGVSAPTPGGITTRELFRLLRVLASDERLAGIEIVEAAPPLCPDGRTAEAGARAIAHALSVAGAGPTRD
jgi:arginase family enzyme